MEGRCTKCGTLYRIEALEESFVSQACPYCGATLEAKNYRGRSFTESLNFAAIKSRPDLTTLAPPTIGMKPLNASNSNDEYIMNREGENPYLSGLQKAIEDFKMNN